MYWDFHFKIYAFVIGRLYLGIPVFLSFIFPPLKRTILEYEKNGTNKATFVISLISSSLLFFIFFIADSNVFKNIETSVIVYIAWYIGYFFWGYFALFLLYDYELKSSEEKGS